jgi:hypothetical protein
MAPASPLLVFSTTNLEFPRDGCEKRDRHVQVPRDVVHTIPIRGSLTHARDLYRQCRPDTQHIPNRSSGIAEKLQVQATWRCKDDPSPSSTYVDQRDPPMCCPVIFIDIETKYFQEGNVWEYSNCRLRRPCVTQFSDRLLEIPAHTNHPLVHLPSTTPFGDLQHSQRP